MIYFSTDQRRFVTLCNSNYSPEGIYHPDRTMEEYDLLYMIEGNWDIVEHDVCHRLESGQLLILEPGLHHYSPGKCSPNMRNMYIHCSVLDGDGVPNPDSLLLNKITDCSNQPQIAKLFLQIIETYWSDQAHAQFRLSALLDLLLAELSLSDGADSLWNDQLIRDVIHRFHSHPDRFFSPKELAAVHAVSIRSLSDRFKKATGTSIHRYQLMLKLNSAHEQLPLYPNRGLKDFALSLGFYDEFQFSRHFKRQFGYSPSSLKNKKQPSA